MKSSADIRQECIRDLRAIPQFLKANDAGVQLSISEIADASRDAAFEDAFRKAEAVESEAEGTELIGQYLRTWRTGHLAVHPVDAAKPATAGAAPAPARLPSAEALSESTALLTIPTFFPGARKPLESLLEDERPMLEGRPNWIIDVRGNDGGADTTFAPLLPWLMPDGWLAISERIFVTDANIRAEETVCELFAPGDPECIRVTQEFARRMRAGVEGGWVQQEYDAGWRHERPAIVERKRPVRVAILVDSRCGSSSEQFLLTTRQSFSVKLVGRSRTGGVLDASNLRPWLLPSGSRRLWYATTLSNRLPAMPVDGIGVCPDVLLPAVDDGSDPRADVLRTQRWLESASW